MIGGVRTRLRQRLRPVTAQEVAFARGARYGQDFRDHQPPTAEHAPGELERFFDAHCEGPGIWKWRHYFDIYERHFGKFVGRPVDVVEVGVFSGGSFLMWASYFGDQARFTGIDIEDACRTYESDRVRITIGDQGDPAFWNQFAGSIPAFDILIDDGGHEPEQQIATLEGTLPHLRPGGVYLCEDSEPGSHRFHDYVNGLSRQLHEESPRRPPMIHDGLPLQRSIDSIHIYPFVTVIEKRVAPLDTLTAERHGTEWQPFYDENLDAKERGERG